VFVGEAIQGGRCRLLGDRERDKHIVTSTFRAVTPPSAEADATLLPQNLKATDSVDAEPGRLLHNQPPPSSQPGPLDRQTSAFHRCTWVRSYRGQPGNLAGKDAQKFVIMVARPRFRCRRRHFTPVHRSGCSRQAKTLSNHALASLPCFRGRMATPQRPTEMNPSI
jgi:hypothetical protein